MLADAFPLLARIIDDLAKAAAGAGQALDKVLGPLRTLAGMADVGTARHEQLLDAAHGEAPTAVRLSPPEPSPRPR